MVFSTPLIEDLADSPWKYTSSNALRWGSPMGHAYAVLLGQSMSISAGRRCSSCNRAPSCGYPECRDWTKGTLLFTFVGATCECVDQTPYDASTRGRRSYRICLFCGLDDSICFTLYVNECTCLSRWTTLTDLV